MILAYTIKPSFQIQKIDVNAWKIDNTAIGMYRKIVVKKW